MKLNKQLKHPALVFAVKFLLLFGFLYGVYLFYLGIVSPGNYYSPFLNQHLNWIRGLRHGLINASAGLLHMMGYTTKTTEDQLMVPARHIIIIGYDCLGVGVMCFFSAFVLTYPKSSIKKLIFLVTGLLSIQVLNIFRFIYLTLYWNKSKVHIADQHDIFNTIIYVLIMASLFIWIRYTPTTSSAHENS